MLRLFCLRNLSSFLYSKHAAEVGKALDTMLWEVFHSRGKCEFPVCSARWGLGETCLSHFLSISNAHFWYFWQTPDIMWETGRDVSTGPGIHEFTLWWKAEVSADKGIKVLTSSRCGEKRDRRFGVKQQGGEEPWEVAAPSPASSAGLGDLSQMKDASGEFCFEKPDLKFQSQLALMN